MTNSENSSTTQSHGKLIAVVVAAAVVIILAVLSAFVWPGWAIQKNDGTSTTTQNSQQKTESSEPTKPTIDATALPDDASELLKAMPGRAYQGGCLHDVEFRVAARGVHSDLLHW